jgi:hypothetical protein
MVVSLASGRGKEGKKSPVQASYSSEQKIMRKTALIGHMTGARKSLVFE